MFQQKEAHLVHIDQYFQICFGEPLSQGDLAQLVKLATDEKYDYSGSNPELKEFSRLLKPGFVDVFFKSRHAPTKSEDFRQCCYHFARLLVLVEVYKQLGKADELRKSVLKYVSFEIDELMPLARSSYDVMYVLEYFDRINRKLFDGDKQAKPYTAIRALIPQLTPFAVSKLDVSSLLRREIISLKEAYHFFFVEFQKAIERMPYRAKLEAFRNIVCLMQKEIELVSPRDRKWVRDMHESLMNEYHESQKRSSVIGFSLMKYFAQAMLALVGIVIKVFYIACKCKQQFEPPEKQRSFLALELPCVLLYGACFYTFASLHTLSNRSVPLCSPGELPVLPESRAEVTETGPLMRAR